MSTDEPEAFSYDSMNACFTAFDKDGDGFLNFEEFVCVCKALFRNDDGIVYDLDDNELQDVFKTFDSNQEVEMIKRAGFNNWEFFHYTRDAYIDINEFTFCWNKWIKVIVRPTSAILIVDVQNDFISGSLNITKFAAQHKGTEIIEPINRLVDAVKFDAVFYSLDWHPEDHVSFIDNVHLRPLHSSSPVSATDAKVFDTVVFAGPPVMSQKLWPRHCVQNSWGAEFHPDLKIVDNSTKIQKGNSSEVDSYSVFWDNMKLRQTPLQSHLQNKNITDLYVCGIAYDVCVGASATDAVLAGYRTILVDDCCRGVDKDAIEETKQGLIKKYGIVINSNQVKAMVEGRDRRPELGYKLALELRKKYTDL